ncbi:alpha/beta fold hydrolase [Vineibacter terrae]|uniref:Alpha/beta fold hydrolase n=1 Tax=Vineibacter terrae TaxID=2586908 RepID=A0A5C8PKE8_9HYPH|nr:alpha/beta fold hydrolase [Vineibacter terrae]TXL74114.1 alpha/beta fold hydrolase [Vineibacter terrae]
MARQPLILVPGLLCDEDLWRDQLPTLAPVADAVVTMEQTRHPTIGAIAAAILATAPPRFALAGLSMGGMIALEVMRQAPARVTRLALLDTSARGVHDEELAIRAGRMAMVRAGHVDIVLGLQLARFVPMTRLGDSALIDRALKMMRRVGAATYLRQEQAVMTRADSRPSLAAIHCPTLVLCGRLDAATPLMLSQEIAVAIPGARLDVLEDCGHLSTMEKPEAVNRALTEWLAM